MRPRIAVCDDYERAAFSAADWTAVRAKLESMRAANIAAAA